MRRRRGGGGKYKNTQHTETGTLNVSVCQFEVSIIAFSFIIYYLEVIIFAFATEVFLLCESGTFKSLPESAARLNKATERAIPPEKCL